MLSGSSIDQCTTTIPFSQRVLSEKVTWTPESVSVVTVGSIYFGTVTVKDELSRVIIFRKFGCFHVYGPLYVMYDPDDPPPSSLSLLTHTTTEFYFTPLSGTVRDWMS